MEPTKDGLKSSRDFSGPKKYPRHADWVPHEAADAAMPGTFREVREKAKADGKSEA